VLFTSHKHPERDVLTRYGALLAVQDNNSLIFTTRLWLSTVQQDLKQHHPMLPEAADLAQNRPLWRMMSTYGATKSYSCMSEMTTMTRLFSSASTSLPACSQWNTEVQWSKYKMKWNKYQPRCRRKGECMAEEKLKCGNVKCVYRNMGGWIYA